MVNQILKTKINKYFLRIDQKLNKKFLKNWKILGHIRLLYFSRFNVNINELKALISK